MKRDNSVYIVDVLIQVEYRFILVHIYVNSNLVHSTYTTLVSLYILYSCKEVCEVLLCKFSKLQCKSYSIISPVNILFSFFLFLSFFSNFIDSLGGSHPNSATFRSPLNCPTILSFLSPHQLS